MADINKPNYPKGNRDPIAEEIEKATSKIMMDQKICMGARESEDDFIFETVRPFCEGITQAIIKKQDLIEAMELWRKNKPEKAAESEIEVNGHYAYEYLCMRCGHVLRKEQRFCDECGGKVEW